MLEQSINWVKRKKVEFGVGQEKQTEDLEKLTIAHKVLEGDHSTLLKLHEQLQIQLNKVNSPSTSTFTDRKSVV